MAEKSKKLYLITRSDLPIGDQAAQIAHAVEEWNNKVPDCTWTHTMVLLVVDNELKLSLLKLKASVNGAEVIGWEEPDMGHHLTSIACLTNKYSLFKGLKKLGE